MSFWSNLGNKIAEAAENNRKEVAKYMRQYQHYPDYKLEEIRSGGSRYSLAQRGAADNLLRGNLLHIMDEY